MRKDRVATRQEDSAADDAGPMLGQSTRHGMAFKRTFTRAGVSPMDEVSWEERAARIVNDKGEVIFEQLGVEVPAGWSATATNVVASKYFRAPTGGVGRETSVRQLVGRVVRTIGRWGRAGGYFASEADACAFDDELTHLLIEQKASFNSPVWFNVGIEDRPQCSACFINSVKDTMTSILELARTEGMLFKFGSGTGSNLSPIRSSRERLTTGGAASGPVSFMKGYDAFAGVIKSGGRTRRAAKMVILNADHPDIVDFIHCKEQEEKKAWALIDAGYDGSLNGEAYASVFFQNSNNSVRVTDEYMRAVIEDREWTTRAVLSGQPMDTLKARDLLNQMAHSAWVCGDPGVQFDSTINDWHTCPATGRINASNPCSEYMFLDDTACNLASLNLMKFRSADGTFDVTAFKAAAHTLIVAQEILVDNASYPTPAIEQNSHRFRPLGLGYANLGALLMSHGIPYDSDEGRAYAACVTALMTGQAYATSAQLAAQRGPFEAYDVNRDAMLRVVRKHRGAVDDIARSKAPGAILDSAHAVWDLALELGSEHGYRNAQVSVLAPTGTIGFMMDCDTTGVEPDIALVKYKKLVGDGVIKIVNGTVPQACAKLGYDQAQIDRIVEYIADSDTIEGAPFLQESHLAVFDCAFKPARGVRSISTYGHLKMMGAVQPFLSGAISKTVNCPAETTPEEIEKLFIEAWKLGLKSVAVYRDGCKRSQPVSTSLKTETKPQPQRRRLPTERRSITHKFSVGGHEGYLTVGLYDDGSPGEIFVTMAKEGSVVSGLVHTVAELTSVSLQYGVPLAVLVKKFSQQRFEPAGYTDNPHIPYATSVVDYIFRWLTQKFSAGEGPCVTPSAATELAQEPTRPGSADGHKAPSGPTGLDAPPCHECGTIMVRNGSCYKCANCGSTSGCS